ncbi:hypothetical protein DFJ73DRAFT_782888 [Zopfochytrium polystomum]|nr:hypothetical protein DFJ73DRAFT_782888 [Zopfochytrium polystomum]
MTTMMAATAVSCSPSTRTTTSFATAGPLARCASFLPRVALVNGGAGEGNGCDCAEEGGQGGRHVVLAPLLET